MRGCVRPFFGFLASPAGRRDPLCQWRPKMTPEGRVSSAGEPASTARRVASTLVANATSFGLEPI